jgi:hypothetical protein
MTSNAGTNGNRAKVGPPPPLIALVLIGLGIRLHLAFPARLLPARWLGLAIGLPVLAAPQGKAGKRRGVPDASLGASVGRESGSKSSTITEEKKLWLR